MRATVDEVGRVAAAEGIDAHWAKGGTVVLARSRAQLARARAEVAHARRWGLGDDDVRAARGPGGAVGARARTRVRGATYTPDCAAIHPGRLVTGLADAVERRGVTHPRGHPRHRASTAAARARRTATCGPAWSCAPPRATPGPSAAAAASSRRSTRSIIATEPLPAETWERIGLRRRETFSDHRHVIIYGQRTADDRLVFGGRGAPYHFGSRIKPEFDRDERVFAMLRATLVDLFPVLSTARVHARVGRDAGRPARLVRVGRAGPHDRARRGRAGTSATASAPPTSPVARCATWSSAATPT